MYFYLQILTLFIYLVRVLTQYIAGRKGADFEQLLVCEYTGTWLFRASVGICSCQPTSKSYPFGYSTNGYILWCHDAWYRNSTFNSPWCPGSFELQRCCRELWIIFIGPDTILNKHVCYFPYLFTGF